MSPEDPMRSATEALGAYFMGDVTVAEALAKICDAALEAEPEATRAGISMTVGARIGTYVFTHPDVEDIDKSQYDTGDGPCVEAFRTGETVIIHSTTERGPYPEFRAAAASHGLSSVISSPMRTGAQTVGALNLYSPSVGAFDATSAERLEAFSSQAGWLLVNHQAYWDARSLSENLRQAMASRAEIEQAKGIIMASTGCTADEAFDQLRLQSQSENVKLRAIAAEIVRRAQRGSGSSRAGPD